VCVRACMFACAHACDCGSSTYLYSYELVTACRFTCHSLILL
jgi:hypothetical protein